MRILWYSSTPECQSGYGNATRNMVKWLQSQGHFVAVATKHALTIPYAIRKIEGHDILILDGTNIEVLNRDVIKAWNIDAVITFFDVWTLKEKIERHTASWIPIDTEGVNEKILKAVKDVPLVIGMTDHGKGELEKNGRNPLYAPIGYDPAIFYPKPEMGKEFRRSLVFEEPVDPDEMFLVGSVGVNYPGDRKGFIILMQAFKEFVKKHPKARLYLHTTARKTENGINYAGLAMQIGIGQYIAWPHQGRFYYNLYPEEILSEIYSGFDVFCLPTKGEGFGMPVVEAQACGIPAIVTDNTSGRQLCKTGWLIGTNEDDFEYLGSNVWRKCPKPSAVLDALERAYYADRVAKDECSEKVAEYQWQNIWDKYWTPIMDKITNDVEVHTDAPHFDTVNISLSPSRLCHE